LHYAAIIRDDPGIHLTHRGGGTYSNTDLYANLELQADPLMGIPFVLTRFIHISRHAA
jgi:hypothetical protein